MAASENYPPRTLFQQGGYLRQRAEGGIIILRLTNAQPETINAWYEDCNRLIASWQPNKRLRYLHDVRGVGLPTLHTTDRVAQVLRRVRYTSVTDGRGAILVENAALAQLLASLVKRRPQANWQIRCFSDEAAALAWLRYNTPHAEDTDG